MYERWEADEALSAFRGEGHGVDDTPALLDADVSTYRISEVESPEASVGPGRHARVIP